MKGNRGKSNISKVGVFGIKNRLHVSIWQNCTAKISHLKGTQMDQKPGFGFLQRDESHPQQNFMSGSCLWTSAIRCAKSSSCRTPCGNVHWGENESSPNQADIATATPARAVEMGTQQIQQKHPGWAEFMRQKQEQEWRAPRLPGLWAHTILWSLFVNTLITMKWFYKTLKTHYDLCLNNPILETSWFPSAHYVASLALVSLNSDLVNIGVSQFLHQDLDWILWHHQC